MAGNEHRRFDRYPVPDKTFAVFMPDYMKLGWIENISEGGLLFEYIAGKKNKNSVDRGVRRKLDIFRLKENFRLSNIPCKIMHDSNVAPKHPFITSVPIRQCGVKFGEMADEEKYLFDSFLTRCKSLKHQAE